MGDLKFSMASNDDLAQLRPSRRADPSKKKYKELLYHSFRVKRVGTFSYEFCPFGTAQQCVQNNSFKIT